jgi:hypothetical protein
MTIYNIHPNAGCLDNIKILLTQHLGLNKSQAQDVISDVRELYQNGYIRSIKQIVNDINRNFDNPVVYYKNVNHWNNGTRNC